MRQPSEATEAVQVRPPLSNPVIRVGIIGFGAIGHVHRTALESAGDARVVAVSRSSATTGLSDGLDWYHDYREMLQRADIDVVAVCSPNGQHIEHARAALMAGKHVVVEKPLGLDIDQATQLVALARGRELMLASIIQRRFEPQNLQIKELIVSGALGRPVLGEALIRWYRSQDYYDAASWRGTLKGDGGVLLSQGLHTIDLLCWFLGPAKESYGLTATLTHDMEAEDTAVAVIRFASGALGVLSGTTATYPGVPEVLSMFFDRGQCTMSGSDIVAWTFPDIPVPEAAPHLAGSGAGDPTAIGIEGHRAQWADILSSLRRGTESLVTGEDALDSLKVILQSRRSSGTVRAAPC